MITMPVPCPRAATVSDVVIRTIAQVAVELYAMGMPTHGRNLSELLLVIRFWDERQRTIELTRLSITIHTLKILRI